MQSSIFKSGPFKAVAVLALAAGLTAGHATPWVADWRPADKVHARTTTVNGLKVFYREAGNTGAPTIVLLHGFPSSSHMFRELIPQLADHYHVIAPDYIGFGYSAAPPVTSFNYTFDNLTRHVQGLLDQLGVKETIYYMHDYGGPIGMRLATAHPERVKGLVIQNSNVYLEGVGKPVSDVFLPLWQDRNPTTEMAARGFLKPELTQFQYTAGARNPASLSPDSWTLDQALLDRPGNDAIQLNLFVDYQHNVALYSTWQAYLRAHQPRTLIAWGKGDPLFVPAGAEAYKRDLPHARLVWLDSGHFALEEDAARVARLIEQTFH